ncbi:GAF domain-containing protein [Actinopolymorpha singaporensis]|uniref:GAF domain-containing protein n=2 Tax=Actinopolymorpha singaporensis TaxID=117157 RepID=A0A1H1R499_9ACTN|nr:GAF domain-containing protein [Actinopolymorpha singaporensis]
MDRANPFRHLETRFERCDSREELHAEVCRSARELTGAAGTCLVVREGDLCHHVSVDSDIPLWLGQRFPMDKCLSGWAIRHQMTAVAPDIHKDTRPAKVVHLPTPVHSVMMCPIIDREPVGAIGACWPNSGVPSAQCIAVLEKVASLAGSALHRFGGWSGHTGSNITN